MTNLTADEEIDLPIFDFAKDNLRNYDSRVTSHLPLEFWNHLDEIKRYFVHQDNQQGAKAVWCLETIGQIQDTYISVFNCILEEEFRKAWDLLVQCENCLHFLDRHFVEWQNEYGVEHIRIHSQQLQELYHLKIGFSPACLFEKILCSVCNCERKLRRDCGHVISEIYDGEMCHNIVEKAKILHISLVDSPAQKIAVIWPENGAMPQFNLINKLANQIQSPWAGWTYQKEIRRKFHPAFKNLRRNDRCLCGTGKKYKRCCLNKDEVPEYPHFDFYFK